MEYIYATYLLSELAEGDFGAKALETVTRNTNSPSAVRPCWLVAANRN